MPHPFAITDQQWRLLLANGDAAADDPDFDARPVVKLRDEDDTIVFLLAELDPTNPVLAFGLAYHTTHPMLRFVDLSALAASDLGQRLRSAPYCSELSLTEAALRAEREGCIRD